MIYAYGIWNKVSLKLMVELQHKLNNTQKYNNVKKNIANNSIDKGTPFIFLRFSDGDMKLQDEMVENGYTLFPNPEFSKTIRKRDLYMNELGKISQHLPKQVHLDNYRVSHIRNIKEMEFDNSDVVIKVGNLHASEGKYLLDNKMFFPHLKNKYTQMPVTVEEFIPNARSIRIGFIGNEVENMGSYYICEHVNSKTWLKNNNPDDELVYSYNERYKLSINTIDSMFEEVTKVIKHFKPNLLGVDFVVKEDGTFYILELNDMVGLPEGEFAFNLFYNYTYKLLTEGLDTNA